MYCINVYIDLYSSIIIFKFILLLYTIYYTVYHLGVRRGTGTQTWKWMEDDSFIFILGG